jgi:hypothetical protein
MICLVSYWSLLGPAVINLIPRLGALDVKLTGEDMAYLEEPYKPMNVFLHY